jgi:hypothetical protein
VLNGEVREKKEELLLAIASLTARPNPWQDGDLLSLIAISYIKLLPGSTKTAKRGLLRRRGGRI